jgi:hypothetical protein
MANNEFVTRRGIISLGGVSFPYIAVTASYTVTQDDYFIDCLSGTFSVTLPQAVDSNLGKIFIVKNSGAGLITVDPSNNETIDGSATKDLAQNDSVCIINKGTSWTSFGGGISGSGNGTSGTSGYSGLDGIGGAGSSGTSGSSGIDGTPGPNSLYYKWDSTEGSTEGSIDGNRGFGNVTLPFNDTTQLFINTTSRIDCSTVASTNNASAWLDGISAGDRLQIWDRFTPTNFVIYNVTNIGPFSPTTILINLIPIVTNGTPSNNGCYVVGYAKMASGGNTTRGIAGTSGNVVSKTASYTISTEDQTIIADATVDPLTLILPTAFGSTGSTFTVKRINSGANNVTIVATSSEYIDGPPGTSAVIKVQYQSLNFLSDGANWYII